MSLVQEFSRDGVTYVYNYDDLDYWQIVRARGVYMLYNEMMRNMPDSIAELEASAARDAECVAMAYVLRRRNDDGSVDDFDESKVHPVIVPFVRRLKGSDFKSLEACKVDFFTSAGLPSVESMTRRQLTAEISIKSYFNLVRMLKNDAGSMQNIMSALRDSGTLTS